jgi:hypothetical protein
MKTGNNLPDDPLNTPYVRKSSYPSFRLGSTKKPLDDVLEVLANLLLTGFGSLYELVIDPETAERKKEKMFDIEQARVYALAVTRGLPINDIRRVIGGEMIEGQMDYLDQKVVKLYCEGDAYKGYLVGKRGRKRKAADLGTITSNKQPTKAAMEKERKRLKWIVDKEKLDGYKIENEKRIREKNDNMNVHQPNASTLKKVPNQSSSSSLS